MEIEAQEIRPTFETVRVMTFTCPKCDNRVSSGDKAAMGAVSGGAVVSVGCPECRTVHKVSKGPVRTFTESQARDALLKYPVMFDGEIK